jgi:hypothetical protein
MLLNLQKCELVNLFYKVPSFKYFIIETQNGLMHMSFVFFLIITKTAKGIIINILLVLLLSSPEWVSKLPRVTEWLNGKNQTQVLIF